MSNAMCHKVRDDLRLDRELDDLQSRRMAKHLDACPGCRDFERDMDIGLIAGLVKIVPSTAEERAGFEAMARRILAARPWDEADTSESRATAVVANVTAEYAALAFDEPSAPMRPPDPPAQVIEDDVGAGADPGAIAVTGRPATDRRGLLIVAGVVAALAALAFLLWRPVARDRVGARQGTTRPHQADVLAFDPGTSPAEARPGVGPYILGPWVNLEIDSLPPGADVFVHEFKVCTTPCTYPALRGALIKLTLRKHGHDDARVQVRADGNQSRSVTLERL